MSKVSTLVTGQYGQIVIIFNRGTANSSLQESVKDLKDELRLSTTENVWNILACS